MPNHGCRSTSWSGELGKVMRIPSSSSTATATLGLAAMTRARTVPRRPRSSACHTSCASCWILNAVERNPSGSFHGCALLHEGRRESLKFGAEVAIPSFSRCKAQLTLSRGGHGFVAGTAEWIALLHDVALVLDGPAATIARLLAMAAMSVRWRSTREGRTGEMSDDAPDRSSSAACA